MRKTRCPTLVVWRSIFSRSAHATLGTSAGHDPVTDTYTVIVNTIDPEEPGSHVDVAVIMACRNRKHTTLRCLTSLHTQQDTSISVTAYVVDDASSDGTYEGVQAHNLSTNVIRGTGDLYWNGATRLAMAEALAGNADFFMLLNDDVTLFPGALSQLFDCAKRLKRLEYIPYPIVVGALKDPQTNQLSYGGLVRKGKLLPLNFKKVVPDGLPAQCATFNGNCVLLPRHVVEVIGLPSKAYTHVCADFDYGLQANKGGFTVWQAEHYVGYCPVNSLRPRWLRRNIPLRERIESILDVRGLPVNEYLHYCRRHAGRRWVLQFIYPYLRLIGAHYGLRCVD